MLGRSGQRVFAVGGESASLCCVGTTTQKHNNPSVGMARQIGQRQPTPTDPQNDFPEPRYVQCVMLPSLALQVSVRVVNVHIPRGGK